MKGKKNTDGQWVNKHEFDVWGYNTKSPTYNYDPMYRSTEPYFTGHPFDGSLNIYYADARFYDAETGTWLSPDPIKDGKNWYVYCGNNPVTFVDFTGLFADNYFTNLAGSDFEGDYTLYVNGKKMTVSRLRYDLRTDNDKDQITLLKEAGLISGEKEYNKQKDYYKSLTVSEIAELAGAEDTFSTWKESGYEMITVFNPAMKDQGIRVIRYGAKVTIDVDVHFSGDADVAPDGRILSELAIEGFKGWEGTYQAQEKNGIVYDRFGVYEAVNVKVNVEVKDTPKNALEVMIYDNREELRLEAPNGNNISNTSLYVDGDSRKGVGNYTWNLNQQGAITLYTTRREDMNLLGPGPKYDIELFENEKFVSTARHEIAHAMGLGDAYDTMLKYDDAEIPQQDWPAGDVMWKNGPVTSNDVEMLLEAWKLNLGQEFRQNNLSSVIRLDVH